MNRSQRLWVAAAFAAVGLALAARGLWPRRDQTSHSMPVPALVHEAVHYDKLEPATDETRPARLQALAEGVRAQSAALTGEDRAGQLSTAFQERLGAVLAGDYDAAMRVRARAGLAPAPTQDQWREVAQYMKSAAFATRISDVRVLFRDGVRLVPDETLDGFGRSESRVWPVGENPPTSSAESRAEIVEVRLAMLTPTPPSGKLEPALVGFQFAWDKERKVWAPWMMAVYADPNATFLALPF